MEFVSLFACVTSLPFSECFLWVKALNFPTPKETGTLGVFT